MTKTETVVACATGLALGVLVSFTHPFTIEADLVTASGFLLFFVLQGLLVSRTPRVGGLASVEMVPHRSHDGADETDNGSDGRSDNGSDGGSDPTDQSGRHPVRRFVAWIALSVAIATFELVMYLESPRHEHPTLSSLSDDLTRWKLGHAVLFVAWLGLGWLLLKRPPMASSEPTTTIGPR